MKVFVIRRAVALLSVLFVMVSSATAQTVMWVPVENIPVYEPSSRIHLLAMKQTLQELLRGEMPSNRGVPVTSRVDISPTGEFTPGSIISSSDFPLWRMVDVRAYLPQNPWLQPYIRQQGNTIGAILHVSGGTYALSNVVVEAIYQNMDDTYSSVQPSGFLLEGHTAGGRLTRFTRLDRIVRAKATAVDGFNLYLQFKSLAINASQIEESYNETKISKAAFSALALRGQVTIRVRVIDPRGGLPSLDTSTTMTILNQEEQ